MLSTILVVCMGSLSIASYLNATEVAPYKASMHFSKHDCAPARRPYLANDVNTCMTVELRRKSEPLTALRIFTYATPRAARTAFNAVKRNLKSKRGLDTLVLNGLNLYWLIGPSGKLHDRLIKTYGGQWYRCDAKQCVAGGPTNPTPEP